MTTVILILTLSILILVHEWGHFVVARWCGVRVERFSIGFGPVIFKRRAGETEYVLSLLPLGGYVKMAGEQTGERTGARWEYGTQSVGRRAGIVFAGPCVNYVTGTLLFILIFGLGFPALTPVVGQVLEGYPAAVAGLRPGDRILAVDDRPVDAWDAVTDRVRRQTSGAAVQLRIRRQGQEQIVTVQPKIRTGRTLWGHPVAVAVIGLTPSGEAHLVRYPWPRAIREGIARAWWLTVMTYQSLGQLVTGALSVKESLTGPIGIFYLTSSAAALGWRYVAQLFAVLSVSLAIFNLLPIPVLDGGHILFLGIERLRRRPVSVRAQEVMTQAGMGVLLGVLVLVTYNDVVKFQLVHRVVGFFR